MSDHRNQNGTFGEMGGTVGNHSWVSTTEQSAAGINPLDSAASAALKMDAYKRAQSQKNSQNYTPYVGDYSTGGISTPSVNAGKNALYFIFVLVMAYALYMTGIMAFYYSHTKNQNDSHTELSERVINLPEQHGSSIADATRERNHLDGMFGVYMTKNPKAYLKVWKTCIEDCVRPSTQSLLTLLPSVEPANQQNFLQLACATPGRYPLGYAHLEATPQGCVITNYEDMKAKSLANRAQAVTEINQSLPLAWLKFLGTLLVFVAGTVFYIKKRE